MITFELERDAERKLAVYRERVRVQIMTALRRGMREAMKNLAQYVVTSKLAGDPIGVQSAANKFTKPGDLANSILAGVRVTSNNDDEVYGSLSGRPKSMPNLGLWQEFGTNHPGLSGKLSVFVGRDGIPVFTRRIRAFSIAPRPFLNPSLDEQRDQIISTIRENLEAMTLE